jgi:cation:H+ antiporter
VTLAWLGFAACVAAILVSGVHLSRSADVIAEKTGLSRSWIGVVLLATVTSLPELVTGVSAVAFAGVPNIALGDALGSCVFNLVLITILDLLHRGEPVLTRASQGHILSAGFGVVLIGFIGLNVLLGTLGVAPAIGHVAVASPAIVVVYLVAMRSVYRYERRAIAEIAVEATGRYAAISLRQAVCRYLAAAAVVVAAGTLLPFVGDAIATATGWRRSFVGTVLIAFGTSVPELVVTVAAARVGALDMAIGNLFGSNLFDTAIVALDDIAFLEGPLFAHVAPAHAVSALTAVIMTGVTVVALLYRARGRLVRAVGWPGLLLLSLFLLNAWVLYAHGE